MSRCDALNAHTTFPQLHEVGDFEIILCQKATIPQFWVACCYNQNLINYKIQFMKWININEVEPQPGEYYLIYEDNSWYLASFVINGEFIDSEGQTFYPKFYSELEKPE